MKQATIGNSGGTKAAMHVSFVLALISLLGTACSDLDVVAKYSVPAFEASVSHLDVTKDETSGRFTIAAPDAARLVIATDFTTDRPDIELVFDAKPFLDAGLDPAKLPTGYTLGADKSTLTLSFDIGAKPLAWEPGRSVNDAMRGIVASYRKSIGYHDALDHYGIALGNGNMFEWARDLATNDKDIVFVLAPQPFIDAGVDPARVSGFVFAKVPIKDENGTIKEVEKLLRPYDLK